MQLNRPIFFVCLFYMAGIFAAAIAPISWLVSLLILLAALIIYLLFFLHKDKADFLVFILFFMLGMLCYSMYTAYFPPNHISKYIAKNGNNINAVDVVVGEDPAIADNRVYFSADIINAYGDNKKIENLSGKIRVTIEEKLGTGIEYGDVLNIKGVLREPGGIKNAGEFDYKKYLENRKIYYTIYAKQDNVLKIGKKTGNYLYYFSYRIKHRLVDIMYSSIPFDEAKILDGIMLGNERRIPYEVYDRFNTTGTVHILAVSGLKVGLIALFVFLVLKAARVNRKISALVTVIIITVFTIITGMAASAVRATIMSYAVLLCLAMERDADVFASIAAAAMVILLVKPVDLFDIGFQLSFLATFGLIYCNKYFMGFFKFMPEYAAEPLAITLTAQIFLVPPLAYTFHMISLVSLIANFFIVPLTSLIIMIGLVMWSFGTVSMWAARVFGASIWLIVKSMMFIVNFLASVPFAAISVKTFNPGFVVFYYIFFLILPHSDIDIKLRKISLKAVLGFALLAWAGIHIIYGGSDFKFYGLDTRGINAAFVKTQDNKKILMICGAANARAESGLYSLRNTVIPFLKHEGVNTIDYLILLSAGKNTEYINKNFRVMKTIYGHGIMLEKLGENTDIEINTNGVNINYNGRRIIFARHFDSGFRYEQNAVIYLCSLPGESLVLPAGDSIYFVNSNGLKFSNEKEPGANWAGHMIDLAKTGMAEVILTGHGKKYRLLLSSGQRQFCKYNQRQG